MNSLVQLLIDLRDSLQPAPGTSPRAIADVLRVHAASAVMNDPAQAQLPPGDVDPLIADAIRAGAERAATLRAAGTSLRLIAEDLPVGAMVADLAERRSERFGPFVERSGRLERFASIESGAFIGVNTRQPVGVPAGELLLLIPAGSTPLAADGRTWTLPPGSVWIQTRFLVAGGAQFAGVRIAAGTLRFDRDVVRHGSILVPLRTSWTLTLELEQPSPGSADGSDADGLALQLPTRLEVHSNASALLTGDAVLTGFGSDLHLTPAGPAFLDGNEICFPLQSAEPVWSIAGNRSRVAQFSGSADPTSPRWTIPVSGTQPDVLGDAAHGGSIAFGLAQGLTSTLAAQDGGPFRWFLANVRVNAEQVEIQAQQADSAAGYDLELWTTSRTKLRFAGKSVTTLVFRSERRGGDAVAAAGGQCSNEWDQPRRADGEPFAFTGSINVFGLLSSASSIFMSLRATAPAETELLGFALQNLYLVVRAPRELALHADFEAAPLLPSGNGMLAFDVNVAVPTLPDPYAANLVPPDTREIVASALRVNLPWTEGRAPTLEAHLDGAVPFPEPRFDPADGDDDERLVYSAFRDHLNAQFDFLRLLDLSSNEHLFGIAFESPSDHQPTLVDNQLSIPMNRMRLLMMPQVQWEPVQIEPPLDPGTLLVAGVAHSTLSGGPTLVGANSVKLVPALPGSVSEGLIEAIDSHRSAAALFSLPFGLRAMVHLDRLEARPGAAPFSPATETLLHQPSFGDLTAARQLRLTARGPEDSPRDPSRVMPGMLRQLGNLARNGSVLDLFRGPFNAAFTSRVPLHHADLSGYGLSSFSEWHEDVEGAGFSKVELQVLNGRTAYEVIQFRSILFECGARVVRTVILERHNSSRVVRFDSGWVAVDAGSFSRPPTFQRGALKSFQNIRRIRAAAPVIQLAADCSVQPVIFDADAEIDGARGLTSVLDRPGYVQLTPTGTPMGEAARIAAEERVLRLIFERVHAIGSPVDCAARIGGTLNMQLSSLVSDIALDDARRVGFAAAVVGAPRLPRAGQWTVVRIEPTTLETAAVAPRRGTPVVRDGAGPFRFREPSDARLSRPRTEYALLMATETCRALFRTPKLDPNRPGEVQFDAPPLLADPYSLVQSTGAFPRPNFALPLDRTPTFRVSPENVWRIDDKHFGVAAQPLADFMQGGGWGMTRSYGPGAITLDIDSSLPGPFEVAVPPAILNLALPAPLGDIIELRTQYRNVAGSVATLAKPDLVFKGALEELTKTLDSLSHLLGLPFNFDVSVTAGSGQSPSFVVHLQLVFRIGDGPEGRVEIGIGKFYGQFLVRGELEAALTGVERAVLFIEFQGDVQQGILPPLLYAGGLFRFSVELRETGSPIIQLTLGVVISIGGDLIPGLLAVEGTIKYGYSLIPETLEPGILLGIEARAKLLGGLIGFSFGAEAMARIRRNPDLLSVNVFARIRIAASIQVAIFFDEDIDFETQFSQDIPLAALGPTGALAMTAAAVVL